jgi:Zn-dependent M28 family amino/carboxypeptidase
MCRTQNFESFELSNKLLLKTKFIRRDFVSPNVIGSIEGSDSKLKDEYIVVSAHYDHLGVGLTVEGDSVYNGVLDNAIGVSALLELARLFSQNSSILKRSVVFLFVTGEEKGLLGSSYFIEHSPIPKSKIIANVNIDGLAVYGDFNSIVGVGSKLSTLGDVLEYTVGRSNLKLEKMADEFDSYESFLRSDQLAFAISGIPSILISDGFDIKNLKREEVIKLWKDYINNRYHTPFDDLSQKINYKASVKHINLLYNFISNISSTQSKIEWNSISPFQRVKN